MCLGTDKLCSFCLWQIQEAFNMIDQNRDGFIEKEDLHDMLASLGKNPTDDYLEAMMNEAPGPINFTMFLTLFGERLQGTDPEDVIKNAFGCFDEDNNGLLSEDRLRELLTTMGDRFTDEEVRRRVLTDDGRGVEWRVIEWANEYTGVKTSVKMFIEWWWLWWKSNLCSRTFNINCIWCFSPFSCFLSSLKGRWDVPWSSN